MPKTDISELEAFLQARNAAFESDDLSWAAQQMPPGTKEAVVEMAFHKARVVCGAVSDEKRAASQQWLEQRGLRTSWPPST